MEFDANSRGTFIIRYASRETTTETQFQTKYIGEVKNGKPHNFGKQFIGTEERWFYGKFHEGKRVSGRENRP